MASGRESFSPDASYYDGPLPKNLMRFVEGPPKFAAEVRSETATPKRGNRDRGKSAKIIFAAGTEVVWDVDPVAECLMSIAKRIFTHELSSAAKPPMPSPPCQAGGFGRLIFGNFCCTFFSHRDASPRILAALAFCLVEEEIGGLVGESSAARAAQIKVDFRRPRPTKTRYKQAGRINEADPPRS